MATSTSSGSRSRLSRSLVVAEAITFVDEHGLPALSMRRLGRQVGVEAMSLYRYVSGREDLLEAMVDKLVLDLRLSEGVSLPTNTWQAYLQWLAHSVRAIAVDHPHIFPLIATRNPTAPWLRPPLRSLEVVEDFLNALLTRGFSDRHAVFAYQMFTGFLLGQLLVESTQRSTSPTLAEDQLDDDALHPPLDDFPSVQRLATSLMQDRAGEEFEDALEVIINRLDAMADVER